MSLQDRIKAAQEEYKKPVVSIPNDAVVKCLLTGVKYTKKGEEAASIKGGIGIQFCFLGYYVGEDMSEYKPTIDYSDIKNITFPQDVKLEDGTTERPGLFSQKIYLSPGVLKARSTILPSDASESMAALLYASNIGFQLGTQMQEPFISAVAQSGLCTFKPDEVGMESFRQDFPIVLLYRHTYWKEEMDYISKKMERRFNENLRTWRPGATKDDKTANLLAEVPLEYMQADTVMAILDALNVRQEQKKAERAPIGGAPSTDIPF